MKKCRIAILASGSGSNAEHLVKYFSGHSTIQITKIFTNRSDAGVLDRAEKLRIPTQIFSKEDMRNQTLLKVLLDCADWLILAGFLWKIPLDILKEYEGRILNIHPSLLPKYGGRGMFGMNVHRAVHLAGEKKTGITIHQVNEHYDEGTVIFQKETALKPTDTPEMIAKKVQKLEHQYFPKVVEKEILKTIL